MKYIIHSNIAFDTTEYILTSLHDSHASIKLSTSAGRILEELIKNRNTGLPVTREHLFTTVWKTHGLEPSNGNLNQQVSLIRKTLTLLGLNSSSIITVPKRGLKINNQLIIEAVHNNSPNPQSTVNPIENQINNTPPLPNTILKNTITYVKYILILTAMLIIIFSIGFIYLYNKTNNTKLYCCKEINSCDICDFPIILEFTCNNYNALYSKTI
ncbi:transcriptional regulatory protein, C terminal domain [Candidatus Blochmanniella floridana]|uniref:Transcriptional regulatory protein, C terminal domain n=1 Tax=Blochmanniella floridana TaxID=203907 RepID=Q7VR33_BLOFL|nr:transcriptional regulatory protein, C terminal domain [Candidatus Blochmannia floridanus]